MNHAKDCGPRFLMSARMKSTSSVCNRKTSNVQPAFARPRRGTRRTSNRQTQHSEFEIRSWALSVRRLLPKLLRPCRAVRNRSTNQYLIPPPGYRFRPPWYTRPEFYVPITVTAFIVGGLAILVSMNLADLKNQAATFDLNKLEQMESASVILDRNDKIFGQIYVENRETIPYAQLPRDLVNAIVSVEDAKFYRHHGYVLSGILRATLKNLVAGHVRQGASTITQQLARNSFALKGKTFRRKLLEIFVARRIEDNFNKQKIMELYLNRIYFGGGLYGAEAAARGYFGKPAQDLSLAECATLAGLIKS